MGISRESIQESSAPSTPVGSVADQVNELLGGGQEEIPEQEVQEEEQYDDQQEEIQAEDDQEAVEAEQAEGDIELINLTQVAEHFGIEAEDMYGIEVPMADNQPPRTISELKDEVQTFRREREQFLHAQQTLQRKTQEVEQMRNSPDLLMNSDLLDIEGAIRAIDAQFKSIDWNNVQDPGQASLYRQQLTDAKQTAEAEKRRIVDGMRRQQYEATQQRGAEDWKETIRRIPEWKDPSALNKDRSAMQETSLSYNVSPEELYQITDPRFLSMIRDLSKLKSELSSDTLKAKEVRKRGIRFRKNARHRATQPVQNKALQSKLNKARKSTDRRVINDAVTDLLNQ